MADAMDKIRRKAGPKEYKSAPRLTGRSRLEQRLRRLLIEIHRFAMKDPQGPEALWAMRVQDGLQKLLR